jgi:hypothetical protein
MGALLKQVLSSVGGRGGGSRDFAQGGVPAGSNIQCRAAFARGSGYNRKLILSATSVVLRACGAERKPPVERLSTSKILSMLEPR